MKKSKLLVLGLIALVLAGGLALASCGAKCPGNAQKKDYSGKVTDAGGDYKGRCYFRLLGGAASYMECQDDCITSQLKKQGSPVDLNCNC